MSCARGRSPAGSRRFETAGPDRADRAAFWACTIGVASRRCLRPGVSWRYACAWAWSTPERSAGSGTDACRAACPTEGLFSRVPLAAATPTLLVGCLGLPVGDLLAIGVLGLLGEVELAPADVFERARRGCALAACRDGIPAQLRELAQLLVGQGRTRERVVLAAFDHRPAQARQLAGGRDDRDLRPAPRADAHEERAQRSGDLGGAERGLDQHPAGVSAALFGDLAVAGGLVA